MKKIVKPLLIGLVITTLLGGAYYAFHIKNETLENKIEQAYQQGDYGKTISLLTKLRNLSFEQKFQLANAYYKNKEYDTAIQAFQSLLKEKISLLESTQIYLNLGNIYLEKNDIKTAETMFLKAVDTSNGNLEISIDAKKAAGYFISEFTTKSNAEIGLKSLLDIREHVNDSEINYRIGKLIAYLGDYEYAMKFEQTAIEKDQRYYLAYEEMGNILSSLGEYKEALKYYKTSESYGNNSSVFYYNMGKNYELLKNTNEASAAYNKSITINSKNVESRLGLTRIYIERGGKKAASEQVYEVLKILPENSVYRKEILKLYEELIPKVY